MFHTYSCHGRGIDMVNGAYQFLDLVPKAAMRTASNSRWNGYAATISIEAPSAGPHTHARLAPPRRNGLARPMRHRHDGLRTVEQWFAQNGDPFAPLEAAAFTQVAKERQEQFPPPTILERCYSSRCQCDREPHTEHGETPDHRYQPHHLTQLIPQGIPHVRTPYLCKQSTVNGSINFVGSLDR